MVPLYQSVLSGLLIRLSGEIAGSLGVYLKGTIPVLSLVRYPTWDLNLWLWASGSNGSSDSSVLHSVLTMHILFVIGALYSIETYAYSLG